MTGTTTVGPRVEASESTRLRDGIVVGVDGSDSALQAVEWAADEARVRGAPLEIVQAYDWTMLDPVVHRDDRAITAMLRHEATKSVNRATQLARMRSPEITVSSAVVQGATSAVLLERARNAALTVVGSHRTGAISAALLGSVGGLVAARASGPTVVVRAPSGLDAERPAVVAGIDVDGTAPAVLAFALAQAQRRRLPLHAVLVWRADPLRDVHLGVVAPPPAQAFRWLSEALAGWREKYPDVEVHTSVTRDHPAAGLVAASAAQHLLVVGRHSRHTRLGAFLGSVSQAVLHRATCPVAIVPADR
jgi:nucleotide-binding universal stress UspA family protein